MSAQQEIIQQDTALPVRYDEFEEKLKQFEEEFGTVVYDFSDKQQAAAARSDWPKVSKAIKSLEEYRKKGKADAQAIVNLWDSKAKPIRERLEAVRDKIRSQIEAHEKKLAEEERARQEHREMLEKKVADIRAFATADGVPDLNSTGLLEQIEALKAIDIDESYEHLQDEAMLAHVETMDALETRLAQRLKYEADQLELDKLRKEKEEREAREAEERRKAEEEAVVKKKAEELLAEQKAQPFPAEVLPDNMPEEVKEVFTPRPKTVSKTPVKTRPTDAEIIDVLVFHYRVHESKVIEWLLSMDLVAESEKLKEEM